VRCSCGVHVCCWHGQHIVSSGVQSLPCCNDSDQTPAPAPASSLQISWVRHRCLVEHAPSPQKCAAIGHYWDDTDPGTWASAGGHCLDKTAAQKLLKDPGIEVVEVNVTHDGSSEWVGQGQRGACCWRESAVCLWRLQR
jgi:hypothetical protein